MILRIEDIKEVCSKLLSALDSDNLSTITETLALTTVENQLILSVTNREYIVKTKIPLFNNESFNATVNASVFLKLMNQITTETVELNIDNHSLVVKANGTYTLPMIYDGESLLKLPDIIIENETASFKMSTDILSDISRYNSKEITKEGAVSPVQKLYYVDNKGCITFTTGACVTEFNLDADVKILLDNKLVKLFKLFSGDEVQVKLGEDTLSSGVTQTKIKFESPEVELTSKIPSDSNLISSVPCDAIRTMATESYPYSVVLHKATLLDIINRLMLFNTDNVRKMWGKFEFTSEGINIFDRLETNTEYIKYENEINITDTIEIILEFIDLKSVLDTIKDDFITFNFGNNRSVVIQRPGVYNVIPECVI